MSWLTRFLGIDDVLDEHRAERAHHEVLLREVLRVTQLQAEVSRDMATTLGGMARMFESAAPRVMGVAETDETVVIWEGLGGPQGN